MKVKVIASGSKGNCTLVVCSQLRFLIDVGVSYSYLVKELDLLQLRPTDIDKVFITHVHSDHVKGLKTFLKKTGLKASIPLSMKEEMLEIVGEEYLEYIEEHEDFVDLTVDLIHTSHDTSCSVGFLMQSDGSSLVYITDTGYINQRYLKRIKNKSIYILESNHDEQMLMEGPYPFSLKQRILSDSGHLSNKMAAKYLSMLVGEDTRYIVLAHLSEKNNTEDLAMKEAKERLNAVCFEGKIFIARQDDPLELLEV